MKYSRQESIVSLEKIQSQHPIIIGVGAVGCEVAQILVRNGVLNITMFDFDIIEEHNVVTQGFYMDQIGRPKVECVAETLLRINPEVKINAVNDRWRPKTEKKIAEEFGDYTAIFSCVDDLAMRLKIFEYYKKQNRIQMLFDARIGGEQMQLFSVFNEQSIKHYPTTIDLNKPAFQEGCHVPMIKHSANIGASMLVQQFNAGLMGKYMHPDRSFGLSFGELFEREINA